MTSEPSTTANERLVGSTGVNSLDGLPLMLTVSEAAEVLRISRTSAYKLVEEYRATAGRSGLPFVRLGSRLFIRRVNLAEIVGVGSNS